MAMNRSITVSILLALSLFSALASARLPLDPTEYGHGSTDLIETATTNTLLLPSEPEPVATAEIKPDQVREPGIPDLTELEVINDNNRGEAASLEAQTAPLRPMRLRPINRHFFPKRPMFVRRNRGGCHHHHGEPMVKPWAPREHLSFGNDMVMMDQDERELDGKFQSVDRPRFWIVRPSEIGERREEDNEMIPLHPHHRHDGRHDRHDEDDTDRDHHHDHHDRHDEDDTDRDHHHHHHHDRHDEDGGRGEDDIDRDHHHHHDHDHDEEREEEEEMGGRGGIFKGIRKFLNHF